MKSAGYEAPHLTHIHSLDFSFLKVSLPAPFIRHLTLVFDGNGL